MKSSLFIFHLCGLCFGRFNQMRNQPQPIAARLINFILQPARLLFQPPTVLSQPFLFLSNVFDSSLTFEQDRLKDFDRFAVQERRRRLQLPFRVLQFLLQPQTVFACLGDRFQQQRLLLHADQRCMGVAEFHEMCQQPIDSFAAISLLQHVVANEVVQLLDVFNRDRLVENFHRFCTDVGDFAEPVFKFGVCARDFDAAFFQQLEDRVGAFEAAEVVADRTLSIREAVQFFDRLIGRQVQHLCDRELFPRAFAAEDGKEDGVMIALGSQEFGLAGIRFIIAAAIIGTFDVGPFVAFPFATSGGDVEVANAGTDKQR